MVKYKPTTVTIDIKSVKKNQQTNLADFLSAWPCWVISDGIIQCKEMKTHTASTHTHSSELMTVQSNCMCANVMCDISK